MKWIGLVLAICLAISIEVSFLALPLLFILLLIVTVFLKKEWVLLVAGISGVLLDLVSFRGVGSTGIFLIVSLLFVFLYEQKFEIQSLPFVLFASLLGGVGYFLIFGWQHFILQVVLTVTFSGVLFILLSLFQPRKDTSKLSYSI